MPASGLKPDPPASGTLAEPPEAGEVRPLAFQWSLLAWAALVGVLTGLAIVGFHYLLGFINNVLFGPVVAGLLDLVHHSQSEPAVLELPPPPPPETGTPLKALLQIGLGGLGFLPPPPAPPEPVALPLPDTGLPVWLESWPVVLVPVVGGLAVGGLRSL
ncbi:MAG: chloride channel protein, partial [Vulcanococcus sp.]